MAWSTRVHYFQWSKADGLKDDLIVDRTHTQMWRFSPHAVSCHYFQKPRLARIDLIRVTDRQNRTIEARNIVIPGSTDWNQVIYKHGFFDEGITRLDVALRFEVSNKAYDECACVPTANRDVLAETAQLPLNPYSTLSKDLAAAYSKREETADVRFLIGDDSLPAHEWILRLRVPYFETLFTSGMRETETKEIKIDDAVVASFSHVLKFIYCAQLPADMKTEAANILPIAEKYGIDELKAACVESLREHLRPENVVATLIFADLHQCPDLRQHSVTKLAAWKDSVAKTDLDLLEPHPHLLLQALKGFW